MKNQLISRILDHKILIIVVLATTIFLTIFGVFAVQLKNRLMALIKISEEDSSNDIYYATKSAHPLITLEAIPTPSLDLLGSSDTSDTPNTTDTDTTSPTPLPLPTHTPTPTPFPTSVPAYTSTATSCIGTPMAYYSEAIVSASSATVNSTVTITIELRDCNNNIASVNDNLSITLSNSDSGAKINGNTAPVSIQAQNGKGTFSVTSSNSGTDTFVVSDTSRSFTVTDPHNHNPSVTFGNNSSGNSNCTTASGTANSWYSDVYPASPVSKDVGSSATFSVMIRDCDKNPVSASDSLTITLTSGDPTTRINGNNPSYTITTQNGQASFTVTSENAGTNTFTVQDTTNSFAVTDPNNNNPSAVFNAPANTSTPEPTNTPSPTSTPTDTPITGSTPTSTPSPSPTSTPTLTPTPN